MLPIGIFAKTYFRDTPAALATAIRRGGFAGTQLNLSALGLATIPSADAALETTISALGDAFRGADVALWGISATYNMAHPDAIVRREQTLQAASFIQALRPLAPAFVSLCSGSRHADAMWLAHAENASTAAWYDFRSCLDTLLAAAADSGLLLAIEPEPGTVISDAATAVRLARELGPDAAGIRWIFDGANLCADAPPLAHATIVSHAIDLLGPNLCAIHLKDTVPWYRTLAGRGGFDLRLLRIFPAQTRRTVPHIIQDCHETTVGDVSAYVQKVLQNR